MKTVVTIGMNAESDGLWCVYYLIEVKSTVCLLLLLVAQKLLQDFETRFIVKFYTDCSVEWYYKMKVVFYFFLKRTEMSMCPEVACTF